MRAAIKSHYEFLFWINVTNTSNKIFAVYGDDSIADKSVQKRLLRGNVDMNDSAWYQWSAHIMGNTTERKICVIVHINKLYGMLILLWGLSDISLGFIHTLLKCILRITKFFLSFIMAYRKNMLKKKTLDDPYHGIRI